MNIEVKPKMEIETYTAYTPTNSVRYAIDFTKTYFVNSGHYEELRVWDLEGTYRGKVDKATDTKMWKRTEGLMDEDIGDIIKESDAFSSRVKEFLEFLLDPTAPEGIHPRRG